ncbi:hypothetical protein [Stieleria varia]|uniref:Uncharacterized protein n=1 Tax=Stieleria varia TaxID=2528005 RepID=A0A5C6AXX5_9BACT|nr:hypothetical protein [Stieleria varia]TWU04590.1 hypothetical protein Pla52n_26320 [Stieleria varia]
MKRLAALTVFAFTLMFVASATAEAGFPGGWQGVGGGGGGQQWLPTPPPNWNPPGHPPICHPKPPVCPPYIPPYTPPVYPPVFPPHPPVCPPPSCGGGGYPGNPGLPTAW